MMLIESSRCCIPKALERGLVHIKNALSLPEQQKIAKLALELSNDSKNGFYNESGQLNSEKKYRGRMYGALTDYPKVLTDLCMRNLRLAAGVDSTIVPQTPTHLIWLLYQSLEKTPERGYIPWHQDNGENDGSENYPVISFSIGDTCDFLTSREKPKIATGHSLANPINANSISLESGDVLVFGGPCRSIWHAIYKMHQGTAPAELPFTTNSRLNLTFRYTPGLIGKEARYQTIAADVLRKNHNNAFYTLSKARSEDS